MWIPDSSGKMAQPQGEFGIDLPCKPRRGCAVERLVRDAAFQLDQLGIGGAQRGIQPRLEHRSEVTGPDFCLPDRQLVLVPQQVGQHRQHHHQPQHESGAEAAVSARVGIEVGFGGHGCGLPGLHAGRRCR